MKYKENEEKCSYNFGTLEIRQFLAVAIQSTQVNRKRTLLLCETKCDGSIFDSIINFTVTPKNLFFFKNILFQFQISSRKVLSETQTKDLTHDKFTRRKNLSNVDHEKGNDFHSSQENANGNNRMR